MSLLSFKQPVRNALVSYDRSKSGLVDMLQPPKLVSADINPEVFVQMLAAAQPKKQELLEELDEITVEESSIGKALITNTDMLERAAIPKNMYTRYLMRRVYISVDRNTLDPAIMFGFVTANKTYIKTANEIYDTVLFIYPVHKHTPQIAITIRKQGKFIKERVRGLVFKAIPPDVLKQAKIKSIDSGVLEGLSRYPIPVETYTKLFETYSKLFDAYDAWQLSYDVPLADAGRESFPSLVPNHSDFDKFMAEHADTYADAFATANDIKLNTAPSDSVRLVTPQERKLNDIIASAGGSQASQANSKATVSFKSDVTAKLTDFLTDIQTTHGFVLLMPDINSFIYKNSAGDQIRYCDACNQDGSIVVNVVVVFKGKSKSPHVAIVTVNNVTSEKDVTYYKAQYAKYAGDAAADQSGVQEDNLPAIPEVPASTGEPELPDLYDDEIPEVPASTGEPELPDLYDNDPQLEHNDDLSSLFNDIPEVAVDPVDLVDEPAPAPPPKPAASKPAASKPAASKPAATSPTNKQQGLNRSKFKPVG